MDIVSSLLSRRQSTSSKHGTTLTIIHIFRRFGRDVIGNIGNWSQSVQIPKNGSVVLSTPAMRRNRKSVQPLTLKSNIHCVQPRTFHLRQEERVIVRTPRSLQNSLAVACQCGQRHTSRGSEIPQFEDRISIVQRSCQEMETLGRIPTNISYGLSRGLASQFTPSFSGIEIPNRHSSIAGSTGYNMRDLSIPGQRRNFRALFVILTRRKNI